MDTTTNVHKLAQGIISYYWNNLSLISASLMTTPLIINHLQISKTLIGNGLETSCLRRSALFQYVKYLMQR